MDTKILNTKYQRQAKKIESIHAKSDKVRITISININAAAEYNRQGHATQTMVIEAGLLKHLSLSGLGENFASQLADALRDYNEQNS